MIERLSDVISVTPGSELVISVGRQQFTHTAGPESRIRVEVHERRPSSLAIGRPELGSPMLTENPATAGARVREEEHERAHRGHES
jgi:hypothetical protein